MEFSRRGLKLKIFVDDERKVDGFTHTFLNARDFINYCVENKVKHIDLLSLDHDLGDPEELTGYDIVKHLPELLETVGQLQFHTANPVGFENMLAYSKNLKKHGVLKIGNIVETQLDSRFF